MESGTCGKNLTWTLDNNGTLTINGKGEMEDITADKKIRGLIIAT